MSQPANGWLLLSKRSERSSETVEELFKDVIPDIFQWRISGTLFERMSILIVSDEFSAISRSMVVAEPAVRRYSVLLVRGMSFS